MTEVRAPQATYRGLGTESGLAFLGIPYAAAPLGPLRFRPPQGLAPGGIVEATRPGAAPPQIPGQHADWMPERSPESTGEDCLNLNLWTPAADGGRRPVIVHVFGGGFQGGSGNGGPIDEAGFAAGNDVVLVRPNLRTGALGFLHLAEAFPDLAASNRGMLDLIAALGWVRENIAEFGGDPGNVTLTGLSSGAFTVAALYATEAPGRLFHRAWMMSGSASRIVAPETAAAIAADLLARTGVAAGDIAALESLPVERLLKAQAAVLATDLGERNAPGGRTLGIVLDGTTLARHPLEAIAEGSGRPAPMVLGYTSHEARAWYSAGIMGKADEARLRRTIACFAPERAEAELAALKAATGETDPTALEEAFLSARIYRDPAVRTAAAQRAAGATAWLYEFAHLPPEPHRSLGASHGFDEPFVFGLRAPERVPFAAGDPGAGALAQAMESSLVAFARTGAPGWQGDPEVFA
jgi:para-nitrobenzyl esterase